MTIKSTTGLIGCWILLTCFPLSAAEKAPRAFINGEGPGWVALGEKDFADVNGNEDTWKFEASLREVALSNNATFIAKAGHFCDRNSNQCALFHGNARKLLTYDRNHMSFDSALALGDWISKNLPELPKELVAANLEQRY